MNLDLSRQVVKRGSQCAPSFFKLLGGFQQELTKQPARRGEITLVVWLILVSIVFQQALQPPWWPCFAATTLTMCHHRLPCHCQRRLQALLEAVFLSALSASKRSRTSAPGLTLARASHRDEAPPGSVALSFCKSQCRLSSWHCPLGIPRTLGITQIAQASARRKLRNFFARWPALSSSPRSSSENSAVTSVPSGDPNARPRPWGFDGPSWNPHGCVRAKRPHTIACKKCILASTDWENSLQAAQGAIRVTWQSNSIAILCILYV